MTDKKNYETKVNFGNELVDLTSNIDTKLDHMADRFDLMFDVVSAARELMLFLSKLEVEFREVGKIERLFNAIEALDEFDRPLDK